jgi:hypothetical protein
MASMASKEPPLRVETPAPAEDRPSWKLVALVSLVGLSAGLVLPRVFHLRVGPTPPNDAGASASASPSASGASPDAKAASGHPAPASAPSGTSQAEAPPAKREQVVVGKGRITKCADAKNRKVEPCGELLFDPVAVPRLQNLASCGAAVGLDGLVHIGFEIDFDHKELKVVRGKKTPIPSTTVAGLLRCASKEFVNVSLVDVPHEHRYYTLSYPLTFYPPGKQPEAPSSEEESADAKAGTTTNEASASGTATVVWDTANVRKEPRGLELVTRAVRGARVKLLGKQGDWYHIEVNGKDGWVPRSTLGL